MRKIMARIITIEFPVFSDFIFHVEISKDFDKTIKKYPSIAHLSGDNDNCDAVTLHSGGLVVFIFFHPNPSVGNIAHESWHALRHMFNTVGVELDSETVAYHLGFTVNSIFKF